MLICSILIHAPRLSISLRAPDTCGGFFDIDGKRAEISGLEERMGRPNFWRDQKNAREVAAKTNRLKQLVNRVGGVCEKVEELEVMCELIAESTEAGEQEYSRELVGMVTALHVELESLEIRSFLTGPHDSCNAILSLHAGAGGTESCDWTEMLLRLYTRWAERRSFGVEIQDVQPGDEAGISRATLLIEGDNAYGYAKAERGVQRLVRISPFDSNRRRHTSFCAVDVIAEIDDDIDLEIADDDLRIDTYRSRGKGGQHVNKTDSAVRMTHLPTGIVVACQNERSQHKNRAVAMTVLKSRIYEKLRDEKRAAMERFYGEKNEIGWGRQIRSYVFQPYQLVKDLRTNLETSDIQSVMDGDIDCFINAWLRAGSPIGRKKPAAVK